MQLDGGWTTGRMVESGELRTELAAAGSTSPIALASQSGRAEDDAVVLFRHQVRGRDTRITD